MRIIISILISLIAFECSNFPFENIFFYISTAMELYEFFLRLQKKYKKYKKRKKHIRILIENSKPDKTDTASVNNL